MNTNYINCIWLNNVQDVDVDVFKKFNKVKALTDDFNLVIKAIKTLDDIEVRSSTNNVITLL